LRGTGIANTARRKVAVAGIQPVGHYPWYLPADLLVHRSRHSCHLASARYHPGHIVVPHPKKDLGTGLVAAIRKQAGL
jgi:HicA toxin of bacterial toxin-antitoxin,